MKFRKSIEARLCQCEGKGRFATREKAEGVSRGILRHGGGINNAYQCKHCGFWHVGSRAKGQKVRERRPRQKVPPFKASDVFKELAAESE